MISDLIVELIGKGNEMLPFRPTDDIRSKASKFLAICSAISEEKKRVSEELIQLSSIEKAVFAKVFMETQAKTVQEKNILAVASEEYLKARMELKAAENAGEYLSTQLDIFKNAHLFYRQQLKEHTNG